MPSCSRRAWRRACAASRRSWACAWCDRDGDSVYLRGESDYERSSLKLTAAPAAGLGHLGLRTRSAAALERRVTELVAAGVVGEWVPGDHGHGPAWRFRAPGGHLLELYWETERYRPPDTERPLARDRLGRRGGPGVETRRLDHVNLLVADVASAAAFAWRWLGFSLLDELREDDGTMSGAWLSLGPRPLELVYGRDRAGARGRLHHLAFWVDTREEVLRAADIFVDHGMRIEVPPAQHTIGRSFFLYGFEPGGNRIEVTTGADLVIDPDPADPDMDGRRAPPRDRLGDRVPAELARLRNAGRRGGGVIPGFEGTVLRPGDAGYDEARAVWNVMHDRRPVAVARCLSPADVAAGIAYARGAGAGPRRPRRGPLAARPLHRRRRARARPAIAGPRRGRPGGSSGPSGRRCPAGRRRPRRSGPRSGRACGGRFPHRSRRPDPRRRRRTADAPLRADRRLAAVGRGGARRRAGGPRLARCLPDLFWALRGGGGNFGVVTEFEFRAHPLSVLPILATFHPLERAPEVLRMGERMMRDPATPDALLWTSFLRRGPDIAPWMPGELRGTRGIMSLIEWSGDREAGRELLGEIERELDAPAGELTDVPYLAIQQVTDDLLAPGTLHAYVKAGFAAALTEEFIEAVVDCGSRVESPLSVIEVLSMGGAIGRVPAASTAFPHRDARWLINVPGQWADAAHTEREIAWVRATYAALRPFLADGAYSNFMEDDDEDAAGSAYGATLARLAEIKGRYDPDNVFRLNQNIRPLLPEVAR